MASFIKSEHYETYPGVSPTLVREEFSGKTVLLTGGGSGIGTAMACSFAEANVAALILMGRNESTHVGSVSNQDDVAAAFSQMERSPDILVNNAGYLPEPDKFVDADLKDWWQAFETNVFGTAIVTQAYLRHRREHMASTPGVIININTRAAHDTSMPGLSGYSSSKAAILRMAEVIAIEIPASEARVISLHPGAVRSAMLTKSKLNRSQTDVKLAADFVVWAASEKAAFLNGRFVWVNWNVDELVSWKDMIVERDLLKTCLKEA